MVVILNSNDQLIVTKQQIDAINKPPARGARIGIHRVLRVKQFTLAALKKPPSAMPPLL